MLAGRPRETVVLNLHVINHHLLLKQPTVAHGQLVFICVSFPEAVAHFKVFKDG